MTAKVEATRFSVVVYCTDCAAWGDFASTRESGYAIAASHDSVMHPGTRTASNTLHRALSRKKSA